MMISQYIGTCEVLIADPKIGGGNIKDFARNVISNLLHEDIDVHIRRLIAEFPAYGIKCIENFQSHCANMTFSDKGR